MDKVLHNFISGAKACMSVGSLGLAKTAFGATGKLGIASGHIRCYAVLSEKHAKLVIYRLILMMSIFTLWSKIVKKSGRKNVKWMRQK